jgi:hypothetical protein
MSLENKGLGRRVPNDWSHVQKMSLSDLNIPTVKDVEKQLILPGWVIAGKHDQGSWNACTGFGTSLMLAIINSNQVRAQGILNPDSIHYDPFFLWNEAKKVDEFPDTKPGDNEGSTVHAACSVIYDQGHILWDTNADPLTPLKDIGEVTKSYGIAAYRWATTVDMIRTAVADNMPLSIGINWYDNYSKPQLKDGEWWVGEGDLGTIDGGHCLTLTAASDKRQAFGLTNSWGSAYPPLVWIPYKTIEMAIREQGEFAIVTDH